MVLPGIQALFGFQLIAVFNQSFSSKLSSTGQRVHLLALGLVAIAVGLVMTPAAIHRHIGPLRVTQKFVEVSTRLLWWSMLPLLFGICLDFFLIAFLILNSLALAIVLSVCLLIFFIYLWFIFPRFQKGRHR